MKGAGGGGGGGGVQREKGWRGGGGGIQLESTHPNPIKPAPSNLSEHRTASVIRLSIATEFWVTRDSRNKSDAGSEEAEIPESSIRGDHQFFLELTAAGLFSLQCCHLITFYRFELNPCTFLHSKPTAVLVFAEISQLGLSASEIQPPVLHCDGR